MYESETVYTSFGCIELRKIEVADTEKEASEKGFSHLMLGDDLMYQTVKKV